MKSDWDSINSKEFKFIISLFLLFINKKADKEMIQQSWFFNQSKIRQIKGSSSDKIAENIQLIAKQFDFLFDDDEPSLSFYKFFIDSIRIKGKRYKCSFFIDKGIPITDISSSQFSDSLELYNLYSKTNDESYLNMLISALFVNNEKSNTRSISKNSKHINRINQITKISILFQFRSLLEYVMQNYSLLFSNETNDEKFSLGFSETLYETSKGGYGNIESVSSMNLFDFLQIQLKIRIDDLKELKTSGMKIFEISQKTGIPITQLNQIL